MLKVEDNELITRVGPGTPMGEMLREYWMPALRSDAIVPDGAPARVRLVGENFVAFRTSDGQVGFVDEACPHRGASLALGRNEDNSLRCIFHGWKINAAGQVVDTPCEPANRRDTFAKQIKVRHFPVREAGGMIWVYLGKRKDNPPAFPEFEFNMLPPGHVEARRAIVHYNWIQGLEAHIDASHVGVLHSGFLNSDKPISIDPHDLKLQTSNKAPRMELHDVPYGLREGALRDLGDGKTYARVREIVMPFFTFIPHAGHEPGSARATVPIDDEWDAEWYILYDPVKPLTDAAINLLWQGTAPDPNNFAANLGTVANLWHQDRASMGRHWSGFPRSVPFEDFVIQESMGPRIDRSTEQLGSADAILVRVRRMLLDAVRQYQANKVEPWNVSASEYRKIRATATTIPSSIDWRKIGTDAAVHADAK